MLKKNHRKSPVRNPIHVSGSSHGGYDSSSLQECSDRLNQATSITPAPCHSRVTTEKLSNPPQVMSPMWKKNRFMTKNRPMTPYQKINCCHKMSHNRVKEERKDEEVTPKSEPAAADIKEEIGDLSSEELNEELLRNRDAFPPDSEDSLGPEDVADELKRLAATFPPVVDSDPQRESREGATAPGAFRERNGPCAPRRSGRHRVRPVSPDPFIFHTTIWLEHDREAVAHEEPIEQLRDQVSTMEANIQTLRTRVTQIADLRDAQGLREGQQALTARLTEMAPQYRLFANS